MSHAILWHACAACGDNAPPMLILEDDAVVCRNLDSRTTKLIQAIEAAVPAHERTVLLYLGGAPARPVDGPEEWGCHLLRLDNQVTIPPSTPQRSPRGDPKPR